MAGAEPSLAAAQRKLHASCAALASVEGFLHGSVTAAVAAAVVQVDMDAPGKLEGTAAKLITSQHTAS